jgi:hypothetical protein
MKPARALVYPLLLATLAGALLPLGGCSLMGRLFGGSKQPEQVAAGSTAEPTPEAKQEQGPFAGGVLNVIAQQAPPGSSTQVLARLALEFGWEEQVAQDPLLKQAVLAGKFEERVQPALLGLYYHNGFSILPMVGEGHQFNRDSIVKGAIGSSRLLVTTRNAVRIIFLQPVQNVEIVYYQDGEEPQVYSVSDQAVIAVRQSLAKYYLR